MPLVSRGFTGGTGAWAGPGNDPGKAGRIRGAGTGTGTAAGQAPARRPADCRHVALKRNFPRNIGGLQGGAQAVAFFSQRNAKKRNFPLFIPGGLR